MLNQLNTTTKRELDTRYLAKQGSKEIINTSGTISIPDYGLTESIDLYFKPSQDLHGYDKPWAGGAGKNLLPMSVDVIKGLNTRVTWNGNSYTFNGVTVSIQTDSNGNITGFVFNGTATDNTDLVLCGAWSSTTAKIPAGHYKAASNSSNVDIIVVYNTTAYTNADIEATNGITYVILRVASGRTVNNESVLPIICDYSVSETPWEPYSNICPIIGQDKATLSWNNNQGISMNFGKTYYGGIANFDGAINSDWQRIASYNGETLSGKWLSDRDKYVAGTTPTKGAEVVYKTKPKTIRVTKPSDISLTDEYPIKYNGYKAIIKYQPKDTVLEEAKSYTNQQIEKLGLPQAPTTNGNYKLVCTVSSGTPTISWETIQ